VEILQIKPSMLATYASVSISFEVTSKLQVSPVNNGLGGLHLVEKSCTPYVKDYDRYPDSHPLNWTNQFDVNRWGFFVMESNGVYVGGAAVSPQEGGTAVLWDLRVHPNFRDKGVGGQLLRAAIKWIKERGYKTLMVETQNVNVPACKFYSKKGFILKTIDVCGYSDSIVQDETKLLWYLDIK
jgi:ribosomal protein S18 acetylase RimI-like enzyme